MWDRDPTAPATVGHAARVASAALALWGAVQVAAVALERRAVALGLVQAMLAEWGAGRMGIAWSDPLGPVATTRDILRRTARGAALGGAAALAAVAAALTTRSATATFADSASLEMLGVGLVAALLAAVRDELILRGFVLRATRGLAPPWVSLLACGMAAAAARFGVDGASGTALTAEALRGVALAALWIHDRGAWMAWAANASWTWTFGSLLHGGLVDIRFVADADDAASTLVVLTIAALSAAAPRRRSSVGLR
jgi:hypothetical protein